MDTAAIASDFAASMVAAISAQVLDVVTAAALTDAISVHLYDTVNDEVSADVASNAAASIADTI